MMKAVSSGLIAATLATRMEVVPQGLIAITLATEIESDVTGIESDITLHDSGSNSYREMLKL